MAHILRFPSPQMTSYTLESKQWGSQSIYSTWISMASPLLGISSTWVVLVANDTLGCLILMMPMQSFLLPPLALLIRYGSNFPMPPSFPLDWVYFSYPHLNVCRLAHLVFHFSTWRKTRGQTESTTHFSCSRKSALTPF